MKMLWQDDVQWNTQEEITEALQAELLQERRRIAVVDRAALVFLKHFLSMREHEDAAANTLGEMAYEWAWEFTGARARKIQASIETDVEEAAGQHRDLARGE